MSFSDDDGEMAFWQEVLDSELLDKVAVGVVRCVVGGGSLSEKQEYVFRERAIKRFVTEYCEQCCDSIPWSEMLEAHENGGYCARCAYRLGKELNEIGKSWDEAVCSSTVVFLRDVFEMTAINKRIDERKSKR